MLKFSLVFFEFVYCYSSTVDDKYMLEAVTEGIGFVCKNTV